MITLTGKTHVQRELVVTTIFCGNVFGIFIILFLSLILHLDFRSNRLTQKHKLDSYRASIGEQRREEWSNFDDESPVIYAGLRKYSLYFLVGVPLSAVLTGVVLSFYRSVTIATLLVYHFFFSLLTLSVVLFAILALICAHGVHSYSILSPLCSQCFP